MRPAAVVTGTMLRPGDAFDLLRLDKTAQEQTGRAAYGRWRVVVVERFPATAVGTIPDGYVGVLYMTPEQAQAMLDKTRGGGTAADDEP